VIRMRQGELQLGGGVEKGRVHSQTAPLRKTNKVRGKKSLLLIGTKSAVNIYLKKHFICSHSESAGINAGQIGMHLGLRNIER